MVTQAAPLGRGVSSDQPLETIVGLGTVGNRTNTDRHGHSGAGTGWGGRYRDRPRCDSPGGWVAQVGPAPGHRCRPFSRWHSPDMRVLCITTLGARLDKCAGRGIVGVQRASTAWSPHGSAPSSDPAGSSPGHAYPRRSGRGGRGERRHRRRPHADQRSPNGFGDRVWERRRPRRRRAADTKRDPDGGSRHPHVVARADRPDEFVARVGTASPGSPAAGCDDETQDDDQGAHDDNRTARGDDAGRPADDAPAHDSGPDTDANSGADADVDAATHVAGHSGPDHDLRRANDVGRVELTLRLGREHNPVTELALG